MGQRTKTPETKRSRKARRKLAHTPHNGLFLFTFGNLEHARPALAELLPPRVAKLVDLSTLTVANGHFVDPDLAHSESDLLFNAQIAGRPGLIYVLFEHMSAPEHFFVLRLLGYLHSIWQDLLASTPNTTKLPVIIPLVLHHGPSGWTSAVRLEELLDIDEESLAEVADYVPRFGMAMQDISGADDEELMNRAMTALGRVTLLLFRHAQRASSLDDLVKRLARYAKLVRDVARASNGMRAIAAVLRYIQSVTKQSDREVRMAMQQHEVLLIDEETYWDIRSPGWREDRAREEGLEQGRELGLEQGLEQGLERGLEQGLEKGREQGLRSILMKQIAARFDKVPAKVRARVAAATVPELEQMSISILRAQTIAEVLNTDPGKTKRQPRRSR